MKPRAGRSFLSDWTEERTKDGTCRTVALPEKEKLAKETKKWTKRRNLKV